MLPSVIAAVIIEVAGGGWRAVRRSPFARHPPQTTNHTLAPALPLHHNSPMLNGSPDIGSRTLWRVSLRLIPFLFFLYILAYLDRVNVSVAELQMSAPLDRGGLGFDNAIVGFGMGVFFWGYWILEIPSTLSVVRWGARWVFVRVLILWGICAALIGSIGTPFASTLFGWLPTISEHADAVTGIDGALQTVFGGLCQLFGSDGSVHAAAASAHFINGLSHNAAYQFYFFRFMLGFFEGGFFPSVIFYLSMWFRGADRAKAIATFMAAIPLSSMIGLPLSGLLLNVHWFDLPGWRWIFILEGIAPVLAGFATIFLLPDRPENAPWLPHDERAWLLAELDREHEAKKNQGHGAWVHHLGMILALTLVYFCLNVTSYGLSTFLPRILKKLTGLSEDRDASLLTAAPYSLALIVMLINGWHSDRTSERPWHVAVPLTVLGLGIWLTAGAYSAGGVAAIILIGVVGPCMYAHLGAFWPIPTMYLGATAAASAIGFINMIGNLGGSVGPMMVGEVSKYHGSFAPALRLLAPWPLAAAAIIMLMRWLVRPAVQPAPVAATAPAPLPQPQAAIIQVSRP